MNDLIEDVHEILERTGLTYRQLDYWVRKGWLRPARKANGSGSRRGWTRRELDVAVVMCRLVDAGLKVDIAAIAAREWAKPGWRSRRHVPIAPGITVTVGKER